MKKITLLILTLVFYCLPSVNSYAQLDLSEYIGACENADPNANCTSSSTKILGAFIGLANGTPITDANVGSISNGTPAYVFIEVQKTGNKFDLYVEFDLVDLSPGGMKVPIRASKTGPVQTDNYKVYHAISDYVVDGEVNTVYGLENIIVGWDNTNNGTITCIDANYPSCNGEIPDIIAVGPFAGGVTPLDADCSGNDGSLHVQASGGVEPYTISIEDENGVVVVSGAFDGDEVYNLPPGEYDVDLDDSDGHDWDGDDYEIGSGTLLTVSQIVVQPDCNTAGSITVTASGGVAPYLYVLFKNGNGTAEASNETGVFNNLTDGSYLIGIEELQDPPAVNCSTSIGPIILTTTPDMELPTLVGCPTNINLFTNDDGGADCEVIVNYTAPTFNDNCDGTGTATLISGPASGDSLSVINSPYTVVYSYTDAAGNKVAADCSFTITVTDNEAPVITHNGDQNVNTDSGVCGADVTVSALATDNCSVGTPTGVRSDGLALDADYPVGVTTITWNVTDVNTNAASQEVQTITVTDNEAPVIT
ncbi:HYR domain-containing protein, partial [Urechidicola vernalis]